MASERVTKNDTLVYDVGMDTGQDTAHYLRRGYQVVAFEASPELVEQNHDRFRDEVNDGRLTIVHGAIVDPSSSQGDTVDFFVNDKSAWGTVVADRAALYEERSGKDAKVITVPRIVFADALREHGVPYYMKTDIEGVDTVCLEGLREIDTRPAYVSLESDVDSFEKVRDELALLRELGYKSFQVINQKDIERDAIHPDYEYEYGASGEFGPWLPRDEWMSEAQTERRYRELFLWYKLFSYNGVLRNTPLQKPLTKALSVVRGSTIPSWHDTHARHEDVK
ncbi:MAG TPA: FkbM family methyltransferase [Candidatus Saccharimonadales bacterium]